MRKLLLALALLLVPAAAQAQCSGVFPANTLCGNLTGSPNVPTAVSASGTIVGPVTSTLNGLPLWANTLGTQLKDGAGLTVAGNYAWSGTQNFTGPFQIAGSLITWQSGAGTVPFLGANQTFTGNNTFSTGTTNMTGTFQIGGVTLTLPVSFANGGRIPDFGFENCSITASVAGSNLTVALKDGSGADASATSPCNIYYRNATASTGSWTNVQTTAAVSFTANSGSTFGATNTSATCRLTLTAACAFKLWVVAINSGSGTVLGLVDLTNASGVLPLNQGSLISSTACNACATASTIGTIYSTAAQTTKPFVILGYLEWGSGLATVGTWASAPTTIQTIGPGSRRPGDVVQTIAPLFGNITSTTTTGVTFAAGVSTNLTAAITPTMASNLVKFSFLSTNMNSLTSSANTCQNSQSGTTPIGLIAKSSFVTGFVNNSAFGMPIGTNGYDAPTSTSAITYVLRCWVQGGSGGTLSLPALNTDSGFQELQEIMG